MTGDRHSPPYPTGERDPRPWWHRELERRVAEMESAPTHTELALLAQRLATLESETRLLRRSVLASAPVIAGAAAIVTRFV